MTVWAFLLGKHWPELDYASVHLKDIPDEGEALTSNPLTKSQSSKKAFRKQTVQHQAALEAFAIPKKKKKKRKQNLLKSIGDITTAMFVGFLITCRLFSVIQWLKGGIYCAPSCIFLNIVAVFLTLKEHHYKSKSFCHHFLFFVLKTPGVSSFPGGLGSVLTNHRSFGGCEVWFSKMFI